MPIVVRADGVAPQPWRNGHGRTRELLAWPPGTHDWRLRVSIADIEADAPFSAFPGVERWFAVLEGAGVELTIDGATVRVTRDSEPLRFDGTAAVRCRLVDGPTRDLNLMLRDGAGSLHRLAQREPWAPAGAQCGVFSAGAARCVADGRRVDLAPLSLAWFDVAPAHVVVDPAVPASAAWGLQYTPIAAHR